MPTSIHFSGSDNRATVEEGADVVAERLAEAMRGSGPPMVAFQDRSSRRIHVNAQNVTMVQGLEREPIAQHGS